MSDIRYFTIENANRALVYLRPILLEIQIAYKTFLELETNVREREVMSEEQRDDLVGKLNAIREQVDGLLDEVSATGAEVKDLGSGICDFFYRCHDGEVVLLCYRLGDDRVEYWHSVDEDYEKRHPIDELIELERAALAGGHE